MLTWLAHTHACALLPSIHVMTSPRSGQAPRGLSAAESHVLLRFLWVGIFKDTYLCGLKIPELFHFFSSTSHTSMTSRVASLPTGAIVPGPGSHVTRSRYTERIRCITRGGRWSLRKRLWIWNLIYSSEYWGSVPYSLFMSLITLKN